MKNKCEDKTYWYARGYFDGRKFGEEQAESLELLEKWVALARTGEKIRIAYKQGFDLGVEDYALYDVGWRSQPRAGVTVTGLDCRSRSIVPKDEEV